MMLATFLTVLKIIGITLLILIAFILLILMLILFVPVRYRAEGSKERDEGSKVRACARISWLLRAVSAVCEYNEKGMGFTVRVFGIRLRSREEKEERKRLKAARKEERKKKENSKKARAGGKTKVEYTLTEYDDTSDVFKEKEVSFKGSPVDDKRQEAEPFKYDMQTADTGGSDEGKHEDAEKHTLYDKIFRLFIKIRDKAVSIYGKIQKAYEGVRSKTEEASYYIDALSNDALNRQALSLIMKKAKSLFKSIRPRKLKGYVDYGADDPADTGRVLAAAAIAYPIYSPGLKINPDFENKVLAFDATLKGRIYLAVLVKTFIALYFNKKVKRLIRIMKKENGNGR